MIAVAVVVAAAKAGISDDKGDEADAFGPPEHSVVTGTDKAFLLLLLLDFGEIVCRIEAAQLDNRLLEPPLLEEGWLLRGSSSIFSLFCC